ncbi:MAG: hypothetical protein ACQJCO_01475 [cyanobacterium endosymbiont of Rhopalodia sterrenbergii]
MTNNTVCPKMLRVKTYELKTRHTDKVRVNSKWSLFKELIDAVKQYLA